MDIKVHCFSTTDDINYSKIITLFDLDVVLVIERRKNEATLPFNQKVNFVNFISFIVHELIDLEELWF